MDLCPTDGAPLRVVEFAQSAAPAGPGLVPNLLLISAFFAIFYFMVIRPQNKAREEHQALLASLKRGDEVLTDGGLIGTVDEVMDLRVRVEVASGVKVLVAKDAVKTVIRGGGS